MSSPRRVQFSPRGQLLQSKLANRLEEGEARLSGDNRLLHQALLLQDRQNISHGRRLADNRRSGFR